MSYYCQWPAYVSVASRRRKAERERARLQKKGGRGVTPVAIRGRMIASSAWGKAWCNTMEGFGDDENRLPRGRSYVRNGAVIDLQIAPTKVTALVSGSSLYTVTITIAALPATRWKALRQDCAGRIDSLVDLLQGELSSAVMERMCEPGTGLFPLASEIKFSCSCPDGARMCKHVAATLYGIGARLDDAPELLFCLRDVDHKELVSEISKSLPQTGSSAPSSKILEDEDMAAMFGLDLVTPPPKNTGPKPKNAVKRKNARFPASKTVAKKRAAKTQNGKAAKPAKPKRRPAQKTMR